MSNYTASEYTDPDLNVPGHTSAVVYVHQTRSYGLHCEEDGWYGGTFVPDRWRDKHMREAWQRHVDRAASATPLVHGTPTNVRDNVCHCQTCVIAQTDEGSTR